MSRASRILIALLAAALAVTIGFTFAGAAALYEGGLIVVRVHEKSEGGSNVHLAVPGALASLGIAFVPDQAFERIDSAAAHWLPAIDAALGAIERCPDDATLVEVDRPGETVQISTRGGALIVDVDSPSETVHVSIPLRTVSSLASRLMSVTTARSPVRI